MLCCEAQLGDHEVIKLINFIRQLVKSGADPGPQLQSVSPGGEKPWSDDKFLQTVLEEDALLMYDYQDQAAQEASG